MNMKTLRLVVIAFTVIVLVAMPCLAQERVGIRETKAIDEEGFIYGLPTVLLEKIN